MNEYEKALNEICFKCRSGLDKYCSNTCKAKKKLLELIERYYDEELIDAVASLEVKDESESNHTL